MEPTQLATENNIDAKLPEMVAAALKKVNITPGLRIRTGTEALWMLYKAPRRSLLLKDLEGQFGALSAHFGWYCRRVAEELGIPDPPAFALVNRSTSADGMELLTLKPSVARALEKFGAVTKRN